MCQMCSPSLSHSWGWSETWSGTLRGNKITTSLNAYISTTQHIFVHVDTFLCKRTVLLSRLLRWFHSLLYKQGFIIWNCVQQPCKKQIYLTLFTAVIHSVYLTKQSHKHVAAVLELSIISHDLPQQVELPRFYRIVVRTAPTWTLWWDNFANYFPRSRINFYMLVKGQQRPLTQRMSSLKVGSVVPCSGRPLRARRSRRAHEPRRSWRTRRTCTKKRGQCLNPWM